MHNEIMAKELQALKEGKGRGKGENGLLAVQ